MQRHRHLLAGAHASPCRNIVRNQALGGIRRGDERKCRLRDILIAHGGMRASSDERVAETLAIFHVTIIIC